MEKNKDFKKPIEKDRQLCLCHEFEYVIIKVSKQDTFFIIKGGITNAE